MSLSSLIFVKEDGCLNNNCNCPRNCTALNISVTSECRERQKQLKLLVKTKDFLGVISTTVWPYIFRLVYFKQIIF